MATSPLIDMGLTEGAHVCFAQSQDGVLYMVNGVDLPRRWDGITEEAEFAGIAAPTASEMAAFAAAGAGAGSLNGDYKVFVRYLDDAGIPSNFSALPGTSLALVNDGSISYTGIPVTTPLHPGAPPYPLEPADRVAKREIWRNTHGQEVTWYLDVTIEDNETTTASSTKTDEQLRAGDALRMYASDGGPSAYRFVPPPEHMAVVVNYKDRFYFGASTDLDYRSTIMWSEAAEPESVPEVNAATLQEDGDMITGLVVVGPHLYITKTRHIYRYSTAGRPRYDSSAVLVAERGQINPRCHARVEGQVFFLDQLGAWLFNGNGVTPIDKPIRDYITERINWDASDTFHVSRAFDEEAVRFFVALDDDTSPNHALSYDYRGGKWYLDSYGNDVRCSSEGIIGGMWRTLIGLDDDVYVLDDGSRDEGDEIAWSIKLGAFRFVPIDQNNKRELRLYYEPVTDIGNTLSIKLYLDGSSTPVTSEFALDGERNITIAAGASEHVVDLSAGFAAISLDGYLGEKATTGRCLEVELVGSSRNETSIHSIEIDGVQ